MKAGIFQDFFFFRQHGDGGSVVCTEFWVTLNPTKDNICIEFVSPTSVKGIYTVSPIGNRESTIFVQSIKMDK